MPFDRFTSTPQRNPFDPARGGDEVGSRRERIGRAANSIDGRAGAFSAVHEGEKGARDELRQPERARS